MFSSSRRIKIFKRRFIYSFIQNYSILFYIFYVLNAYFKNRLHLKSDIEYINDNIVKTLHNKSQNK
ncbi:hypothetical protein Anas_05166 [Armadillidium nasatum]|uniref:Uncharacterized protein n=1 Tax=Armadillidium nasatum TaxID=96803 RepID=A0A5N5T308_9CRUS|nr:hypothetical protein Anas_05166 [Armadillidium nasatum]